MLHTRFALSTLLAIATAPAIAATFTVNSTADPGTGGCAGAECTLREAIAAANATSAADTIAFAIPGAGPHVISIGTGLPTISNPLDIDGYMQPGSAPNTRTMEEGGSDAIVLVAVRGVDCASCTGFRFTNGPGSVRGLAMSGFPIASIGITDTDSPFVVAGNFFNYEADGVTVPATPNRALFSFGPLRFGGTAPADRNVVGFIDFGVAASHSNTVVAGNLFGMDRNGTPNLCRQPGFQSSAVLLSEPRLVPGVSPIVGGDTPAHRNVFAPCEAVAVQVDCDPTCWEEVRVQGNYIGVGLFGEVLSPPATSTSSNIHITPGPGGRVLVGGDGVGEANVIGVDAPGGVTIRPTSIHPEYGAVPVLRNRFVGVADGEQQIRLLSASSSIPPPNDAADADAGPNRLQNHPVIQAVAYDEDSVTINYIVDSSPANAAYPLRIDFVQTDGTNASGRVTTDLYPATSAQQPRTVVLPMPAGAILPFWTTATDADGRTSPFEGNVFGGDVFADGFED